jgi:hypothetical protein
MLSGVVFREVGVAFGVSVVWLACDVIELIDVAETTEFALGSGDVREFPEAPSGTVMIVVLTDPPRTAGF